MRSTDVRHMAIEVETRLLPARAERGRQAMQAVAARQRGVPGPAASARRVAGTAMVRLGARLEGAPRSAAPLPVPTA